MTRSIQQLPNNTTTAQTQSVYTQTGFNAGDAVYYQNGDYVSPTVTPSAFANPTGSLAFIPSTTGPYTTSGGIDSSIGGISPVLTGTNASGYGFIGGGRGVTTAILSNGNIVNVWIQHTRMTTGASRPYFQVTTAAGVQVVAPTAISTTLLAVDGSMITVTALPSGSGGGFVVAWVNTTGGTATRPNYAIYTNAGGITLGAFNDTTWGTTAGVSCYLSATAMPNGSTFLYWRNTTGVGYYKIIGATGTVIKAWTSSGLTNPAPSSAMGVAVRSTSEILVVDCTAGTQFTYTLINSVGTITAGPTIVTMTGVQNVGSYFSSATCLADGSTFYFTIIGSGPSSSVAGISYYSLPTGNTLSAETSIPQANLNTTQGSSLQSQIGGIYGLSSGGFVLAFCDAANFLRYVVYNSAGVVQSGTNANGVLPLDFPNSFIARFTVVGINETSGFINFYWSVITVASNQSTNIFRAQISNSTYLPTYLSTGTTTLPSTTSSGASTVNMASSTLTNLKYNLVSNTTTTAVVPLTTAVPTPTALTNFACGDVFSVTLTNGKLAVAYVRTSNATLYVNIYSIAGALEQTLTVGVVNTGAAGIRLAALTSGKFVVAYSTSATDVTATVYSTSYTVVYTAIVATSSTNTGAGNNFDMAALTNDQYVIVMGRNSAGSIGSFMYSGASSTLIASYTLTGGGGQGNFTSWGEYVQVRGNNYGGFIVNGKNGTSSSGQAMMYLQTSATTWNWAYSTNTTSSAGTFWSYQGCAYSGSGTYLILYDVSGSNTQYYCSVLVDGGTSGQQLTLMGPMTNPGSAYTTAVGINGLGTYVQVDQASSVPTTYLFGMPGCGTLNNGSTAGTQSFMVVPGAGSSTLTGQGSATSSRVTISPGVGTNAYLVYLQNTTNFPVVTTVASFPANVTSTIPNTQVSTNAAVPINPIATSSSTTIPNTILSGVAANTVPANSTGQLIINGLAQLNTSYPASSNQAFDTTGLAIDGVKGTVKNRVVNMQGNS